MGRSLSIPIAFLDLDITTWMSLAKESFESNIRPRCLSSSTLITHAVSKYNIGWLTLFLFVEKTISTACLLASELKDILHLLAHNFICSRSWFISTVAALGSFTTVKMEVSSAINLTVHLRSLVKSLIYTRNIKGPRMEPCGTPAEIYPKRKFATQNCSLLAIRQKI